MQVRFILLLIIIASSFHAFAQQKPVERDTSFTLYSAFKNAKKKYPFITVANPPVPVNIISKLNLVYCSVGGRQLHLDVFYPSAKSKKSYPAILMIHGGGWRSGDRSQHVPMAQQMASKGYVTVTAEYRLSNEALYPAAVNDLKTAIRWMRANAKAYHIDAGKIAVWGFSAGGQLATLIGTTNNSSLFPGDDCYNDQSDKVQAIVDVDGTLAFIHPESGEGNDSKGKSAATYWFGFSKDERPDLWNQAGALNHVDQHTPPIIFINSAVDRMHAGRSDMIHQLDSLHIYSEVHTLPDTPHPFLLFNPWFEPTLNYTVAFLDKIFKK
ncbi:alpha/beta hydrolase [Mucilaginibacter paludis]|uniref:Lipoprotein n=1 Tax=Mucilaginibacter paludis DSM 18603 TaxID=714943 RepID=H1Y3N6_9SPHI|nr:alpha/beta hydrolase [Mucilaginibacter paludis]EHQ30298.1 lipoprotein [Mucilaginibacter paludis DSM 18603]